MISPTLACDWQITATTSTMIWTLQLIYCLVSSTQKSLLRLFLSQISRLSEPTNATPKEAIRRCPVMMKQSESSLLTEIYNVTPKQVMGRCPMMMVQQSEAVLRDTDFLQKVEGLKRLPTVDVSELSIPTCEGELPASLSISHDAPENEQALSDVSVYTTHFLAKSHPHVGRSGPVCPFVPVSLKNDLLRIIVCNTTAETTEAEIAQLVMWVKSLFMKMQPTEGKLALYKAFVIVFPNLVTSEQRLSVDVVQESLKEKFVEDGMMLGEFHRSNTSAGLRNENWFPLRTPHSCLAMRFMVPNDIPFLIAAKYDQEKVARFCQHFLRNFQSDTASTHVEQARLILEKIQNQTQTSC